jgi:hypothetical protein
MSQTITLLRIQQAGFLNVYAAKLRVILRAAPGGQMGKIFRVGRLMPIDSQSAQKPKFNLPVMVCLGCVESGCVMQPSTRPQESDLPGKLISKSPLLTIEFERILLGPGNYTIDGNSACDCGTKPLPARQLRPQ